MFSKLLGRHITQPDELHEVADEDIEELSAEIGACLVGINTKLKHVRRNAFTHNNFIPAAEMQQLEDDRAQLAILHQATLRIKAALRKQEEAEKQEAHDRREASVKPFSYYFQQVVRNEADKTDYQRWVLQAEMRHSRDLKIEHRKAA